MLNALALSVNRETIITSLYNDKELRSLARYYGGRYYHDLWQEIILSICEMHEDKLIKLHEDNRINVYVLSIMRNMTRNPKSKFGKQIIKDNIQPEQITNICGSEDAIKLPNENEVKKFCFDIIDNNNHSEEIVLSAHVTLAYMTYTPIVKRSYRDFKKETGINEASTCVYIGNIRKLLNEKYEDQIID